MKTLSLLNLSACATNEFLKKLNLEHHRLIIDSLPKYVLSIIFNINTCCQMLSTRLNPRENAFMGYRIFIEAAKNGHLDCMMHARENGCGWNNSTITETAAKYGHLECLKYALENGCILSQNTCSHAIENGNLDCFRYAHENGCIGDNECHLLLLEMVSMCPPDTLTARYAVELQ